MTLFGYHCSHEQFPPDELRDLAVAAEAAGFGAVMSSDHFHPWSPSQGNSGYGWAFLGAAMQATSLPFGTLAIPGGWRYHPAIVAQAAATLSRLFPGRLRWLTLGSGQALSECITGTSWPDKAERNARLEAGAEIIRALWAGETVTRQDPIPTRDATLYTRPADPAPKLMAAALTPETAAWAARWADGLATVWQPRDRLRAVVDRFREGGGEGKPVVLQIHVGWGASEAEARDLAFAGWRANLVSPEVSETVSTPEAFDALTADLGPDALEGRVFVSADLARHRDTLAALAAEGFDEIYIHNTGANQRAFVEAFGAKVLPALT